MNKHFSMYLIGNPIHVCWNSQNKAHFSKMINLRGHMPMFTLKMNVFHLSPWKPHKCVFKPSEQGLFFPDNQFEGHMPRFPLNIKTNEHFPIYLLGNPINVC